MAARFERRLTGLCHGVTGESAGQPPGLFRWCEALPEARVECHGLSGASDYGDEMLEGRGDHTLCKPKTRFFFGGTPECLSQEDERMQ